MRWRERLSVLQKKKEKKKGETVISKEEDEGLGE